jgi:hypothetical protein
MDASAHTYVAPFRIATAWSGLGDTERTLACLEQAAAERDPRLVWLQIWPTFLPLHGNPRFLDLARRIGPAAIA